MKRLLIIIVSFFLLSFNMAYAEFPKAPDLLLETTDGSIQLSSLKGKIVYLDFWASWCKPCKKSFPWLNEIKYLYKDQGLEVLAINLDKDRAAANKFLQQMPANFPVAFDANGKSAASFQVTGMPSSYLIDRKGFIRERHIGFRVKDIRKKEQAIEKLLAEKL
ncbi:MAG: TlpA family protein disulfide reductase [Gammaproteobacteria bacterium]|nr:TlpA family protein disulfide reductase [Gammaproteobacteria bacterium]